MPIGNDQEIILNYWKSLCPDEPDTLPARSDISPQDLGRHVSSIIIMDVLNDPLNFRYRLVGTYVRDFLYEDYTGKSFLELNGKGPESQIWQLYDRTRLRRRPIYCEVPYVGPKADFMKSSTLYLPLASDHHTVDKIIAAVRFETRIDSQTLEFRPDEFAMVEL